jgi:hypothetical protein
MSGMSREEALWAELVDEAGEELIEQAARVSVAQAEAELRAAGFDVEEERARAEAFVASLDGSAATPDPVQAVAGTTPARAAPTQRKKRRPVVAWAAAAAAAAASAGAVYVETRPPAVGQPAPSSSSPTAGAPEAPAAELRQRAAVACDEGRAAECLSLLDQARAKDPAGDATPEVARLRAKAAAQLRGERK